MPIYSDKVMEHFTKPRNVGEIEDADGIGEEGNPICGDMMTFYIKVKDDRIEDVKFKTFGCGAAIAVSSMVSEMAKGKTLDEALKITPKLVAEQLEGLPKAKMHCSNLGAQALSSAIMNYREKKEKKMTEIKTDSHKESSCCSLCTPEMQEAHLPFCKPCNVTTWTCPACLQKVERGKSTCPGCGAAMKVD